MSTDQPHPADPVPATVTDPRQPRCRFGRPHVYTFGPWFDQGTFLWTGDAEHVRCGTCGQVEHDGPAEGGA